jgi:hypothetical protein
MKINRRNDPKIVSLMRSLRHTLPVGSPRPIRKERSRDDPRNGSKEGADPRARRRPGERPETRAGTIEESEFRSAPGKPDERSAPARRVTPLRSEPRRRPIKKSKTTTQPSIVTTAPRQSLQGNRISAEVHRRLASLLEAARSASDKANEIRLFEKSETCIVLGQPGRCASGGMVSRH